MSDARTTATAGIRKGDLMKGRRGLIMGLANDRSLAWGIAKALSEQGAGGFFLPGRNA